MRISDWSSDVCSSDLQVRLCLQRIDVRLRAFLGDEHLRSPTRMEYSQARRSLNAPTAGTYPRVCACTAAPVLVIGLRLPGVVSDGAAPVLPDRVKPGPAAVRRLRLRCAGAPDRKSGVEGKGV